MDKATRHVIFEKHTAKTEIRNLFMKFITTCDKVTISKDSDSVFYLSQLSTTNAVLFKKDIKTKILYIRYYFIWEEFEEICSYHKIWEFSNKQEHIENFINDVLKYSKKLKLNDYRCSLFDNDSINFDWTLRAILEYTKEEIAEYVGLEQERF